jgi:WD40-like Beta Propeller Repeat
VSRSSAPPPLHGVNRLAFLTVLLAACTGTTEPLLTELGAHERVFAVGYWDGGLAAGALDAESALPVAPTNIFANPEPGQAVAMLDVTPDGTQLAFGTTNSDHTSSRVYVASGTGGSPRLLASIPANASSVLISPDGAYVAVLAELQVAGLRDLYVIEVAHAETGLIKVSPDRSSSPVEFWMNIDYAVWSPTSRYLAFTGQLTQRDYEELYSVDLGAGLSPVDRTTLLSRAQIMAPDNGPGAQLSGVVVSPQFDAGDRLWYGATIINATPPPIQLFVAEAAAAPTQIALPARADASEPSVSDLAIAPDGNHVAYGVDTPTANVFGVYYADIIDPSNPKQLAPGVPATAEGSTAGLAFSPDGTKLAYTQFLNGIYTVDVASNTITQLAGSAVEPYSRTAWSAHALWLIGADFDVDQSGQLRLLRFDPEIENQTPASAIPLAGSVDDFEIR